MPLPAASNCQRAIAHKLSGQWNGFWECHVEPDWLLVWHDANDDLELVRLGTHADLFG
jgi:mRNA interferase YafQ